MFWLHCHPHNVEILNSLFLSHSSLLYFPKTTQKYTPLFCTFFCKSVTCSAPKKNAFWEKSCALITLKSKVACLVLQPESNKWNCQACIFKMNVFMSTSGLRCHNEKQHTGFSLLLSYISHSYVSEPASFKAKNQLVLLMPHFLLNSLMSWKDHIFQIYISMSQRFHIHSHPRNTKWGIQLKVII